MEYSHKQKIFYPSMSQRLTHRGRRTYNNANNQKKIRRTPGNKLVYIPKKKSGVAPKCVNCHIKLGGISTCRPAKLARMRKSQRTVTRAYGGNLCGGCLKTRIVDSFLLSEEKLLEQKNVGE